MYAFLFITLIRIFMWPCHVTSRFFSLKRIYQILYYMTIHLYNTSGHGGVSTPHGGTLIQRKSCFTPGTSSFILVLEFNLIHHLIMQEPCIKFTSSDYAEDLCESYRLKIVSTVSVYTDLLGSPTLYSTCVGQ